MFNSDQISGPTLTLKLIVYDMSWSSIAKSDGADGRANDMDDDDDDDDVFRYIS